MPARALAGRAAAPPAGFFGKVPAKGDFVLSRLPRSLVDPWDAWLQAAMAASRQALGDAWLDCYLTSPVWRFVLAPGVCGGSGVAGILIPSVDRVGRYFPFLVAAPLAVCETLPARAASPWFDRAEAIALRALDDDFTIREMEASLSELGAPAPTAGPVLQVAGTGPMLVTQTPLSSLADPAPPEPWPALLDRALADGPCSLWWTLGSERVQPTLVAARDLPPPAGFAAFLDGDWRRWGWPGTMASGQADAGTDAVVAAMGAGALHG